MTSGRFIVFEGPHGSGKTTQARSVVRLLRRQGQDVWYTHEPFLPQVRLVAAKYARDMTVGSGYVLLFAHAMDRMVHSRLMQDKRRQGVWVICDRYLPSTYVYQRMQGVSARLIDKCSELCLEPDTTVFFSVPAGERAARVRAGRRPRQSAFLDPVAFAEEESLYKSAFACCRRRWRRVFLLKGTGKREDVFRTVRDTLQI